MKLRSVLILLGLVSSFANAQTYPTYNVGNLNVLGTTTLSAPLGTQYGGTGLASLPAYNVLLGNGASTISGAAPSSIGGVLMSNGATSLPTFTNLPTCNTTTSALNYTVGVGFTCNPTVSAGSYTGTVPIVSGGTGATTAAAALTNLGAANSGANSNITSLTGLTGAVTGATTVTASGQIQGLNGYFTGSPAGYVTVNAPSAAWHGLNIAVANNNRWEVAATNDTESGSNTGSNFAIVRFSDAGATLDQTININRATGLTSLNDSIAVTGDTNTFQSNPISATDYASTQFTRTINLSGGTAGYVNSAVRVTDNVQNTGETSYEWGLTSVMNNYSNAGNNLAGYLQGNKYGTGPTWAGTFEAIERNPVANPTSGLIGIEVDARGNGTDGNFQRIPISIVCSRFNSSGAATQCGYGIDLQNAGDSQAGYIVGVAITAQAAVGFDTGSATSMSDSLRMASGQFIAFDVNSVNKLDYDGTGLNYSVNNNLAVRLNSSGSILLEGGHGVQINGTVSSGSITMTSWPNKPGSGTANAWISATIDGNQYWIPAAGN